ncbi:hypothetical protein Tco_1250522, partial [Tanacetum coccineum]
NNGGKFCVGPPGDYTKIDNRPSYGEKRQSLEELLAKHQEEYARRSNDMDGDPESDANEVLQHQLPCKELNPGNFTLPCTIGKFNFYAMADLGIIIKFDYVGINGLHDDLELITVELRDTAAKINLCTVSDISKTNLMLLVTTAERLQLLEEFLLIQKLRGNFGNLAEFAAVTA